MQASLMTLPSSFYTVDTSEVSLPGDNTCREENSKVQPNDPQQATSTRKDNQQMTTIAVAGAACMVCIISLFAFAFSADPDAEASADCGDSVTAETSHTLIAFVMGWAMCYVGKCHRDLATQMGKIVSSAKQCFASASSSASSLVSTVAFHYRISEGWFASQGPKIGKILCFTMVGLMCTGCIVGLFISAFMAVPDEEPMDDGFASESSPEMKAFTLGWMFLLGFKLRHELVGLVGSSGLFDPC